ncbi:TPA: AbrB/MazE/SpoVT family DNA-binding domain-containing protein [Candidatus Woesearchaeota archaeon]|nr:AbrB/MazE/SpoVT family DNA-binding domain-containing protein [Candidatus Woesearchaeota archaeon]
MIGTVKVSSRGQIVIPENIRKHLQIVEGSTLVVIEKENKLIVERENDFLEGLKDHKKKDSEQEGWQVLAEKNLLNVWSNSQDDKVWKKYL